MGCWVAGAGLHDPDTCWLLALGKHIFEHSAIPVTDPFSYTFSGLEKDGTVNLPAVLGQGTPSNPRTFVPYQWLSEVFFFLAYKVNAGYSLLVVANIILLTAFLSGPLMVFRALRSPMLPGVGLVILGVVAASFHFLVRPEIFSYLLFVVWIGLFLRIRLRLENNRPFKERDAALVLPMTGVMMLWANLHTGFTSVFIALSIFCVVNTIEVLVRPRVRKSVLILPWLAFLSMLMGSCINPFSIGLWKYIPELFFSPLNKFIVELGSINKASLTEWTFYPYFILGALVLLVVAKAFRVWQNKGRFPIGFAYSVVMPIGVFIAGICCIRLIPFVVIILCAEVAWLLKGHTKLSKIDQSLLRSTASGVVASEAGSGGAIPNDNEQQAFKTETTADSNETIDGGIQTSSDEVSPVDADVRNTTARHQLITVNSKISGMLGHGAWPAMLLLFSLLGVFLISSRVVKPNIPQGSLAFPAPYPAIKVLAKDLPEGRVFNEAGFGDMMIWNLIAHEKPILGNDPFTCPPVSKQPKVFIDTRFDMYGAPLVSDYFVMRNLKPGWNELFQRYKFDWVFMPPQAPISKQLVKNPEWKAIYNAEDSTILVRTNRHPSQ